MTSRAAWPFWALGVLAAACVLLPIGYLVLRASGGSASFATSLFTAQMGQLVLRSAALAAVVGVCATGLAVLFAVTLWADDLPMRRLLGVIVILPLAIPCYVGASAYVAGLSSVGPFGAILQALGMGPLVLQGFFWAALVLTLYTVPLAYLPVRAALVRMDGELVDAARTLGHAPVRAVWCAMASHLPAAARRGALLVMLYTLGEFGAVSLFRVDVFPRVIYLQYSSAFDRTSAALSSLVLLSLVVLFVMLLGRTGRSAVTSDRARPLRLWLGAWRFVALVPVCAYVAAAAVVPLASIVWWIWRAQRVSVDVASAVATSLWGAACTVLPTLVLAVGLAVLLERAPRARVLGRIVSLGFAMPGIVVALGLAFFTLRAFPAVYQTWFPYVLAMLILYCPLAVASVQSAFAGAPPVLEDAARTLGAGPSRVFFRVTLPLVLPGVAAGAILVFISTMKELSASLLLMPPGESSLATRLWGATEDARYAEAAVPALLLVALAAVAAFGIDRRQRAA